MAKKNFKRAVFCCNLSKMTRKGRGGINRREGDIPLIRHLIGMARAFVIIALITLSSSLHFGIAGAHTDVSQTGGLNVVKRRTPWWGQVNAFVSEYGGRRLFEDIRLVQQVNATVLIDGPLGCIDLGFDMDLRRLQYTKSLVEWLRIMGIKTIGFIYAGFPIREWIVEIDPTTWQIIGDPYSGYTGKGTNVTYGFREFYQEKPFMRYAKWSDYFDYKWQYPNGTLVDDPIDCGARRSIDGEILTTLPYLDLTKVRYPSLNWSKFVAVYLMDYCNPYWVKYQQKQAEFLIDMGVDGINFDAIETWHLILDDSGAYGYWTKERFRDYIRLKFTIQELDQMGIHDVSTFDIGQYVKSKGYHEKPAASLEDPVWLSFVVFNRVEHENYIKTLTRYVKDYAKKKYGREVALLGSHICYTPVSAITSEYLDLPYLEQNIISPHCDLDRFGSLPIGKLSGIYKLTRAVTGSNHSLMFFGSDYTSYAQEKYNGSLPPNQYLIYMGEALSNFATIVPRFCSYKPTGPWEITFPLEQVVSMNNFVSRNKELFSDREPQANVGIVYSPDSQLVGVSPIGNLDDSHLNDLMGWCLALSDLHIQYEPIFSEKLNDQVLSKYDVVILPSVLVIDPTQVSMFEQYVWNGGNLILTGQTSIKRTDLRRNPDYSLANITLVHYGSEPDSYLREYGNGKVCYFKQLVGYEYKEERLEGINYSSARNIILHVIDSCQINSLLGTNAPDSVGTTMFTQMGDKRILVNLVNYNVDIETDIVKTVANVSIRIMLPNGFSMSDKHILLVSPDSDKEVALNCTLDDKYVETTIPELRIYAVLVIADPAEIQAYREIKGSEEMIERLNCDGFDASICETLARAWNSYQLSMYEEAKELANIVSVEANLGKARKALRDIILYDADLERLNASIEQARSDLETGNIASASILLGRINEDIKEILERKILFDETHGESVSISTDMARDIAKELKTTRVDLYDSSTFAELLSKISYKTDRLTDGNITLDKLRNYDVLVIVSPSKRFSSAEAEDIEAFVKAGGGLLMVGDLTTCQDPSGYDMNELGRRFGLEFLGPILLIPENDTTYRGEMQSFDVVEILEHPITVGFVSLTINWGCTMKASPDWQVLAWTQKSIWLDEIRNDKYDKGEIRGPFPVLAVSNLEKGNIVALSDQMNFWWWGEYSWLYSIIKWLATPGGAYRSLPIIAQLEIEKALDEGRSGGLERALSMLNITRAEVGNNNLAKARNYALMAIRAAEGAIDMELYQQLIELMNSSENKIRKVALQVPDAQNLIQKAILEIDLSKLSYDAYNYSAAYEHALNSLTLIDEAERIEKAYKLREQIRTHLPPLIGGAFIIVVVIIIIHYRKEKRRKSCGKKLGETSYIE